MTHKFQKRLFAIVLIFLLLLMSAAAYAEIESGNVKQGQIVQDDFFTAGQSVRNEGVIKGDFIAAGQKVYSQGSVEGDIICVAGDAMIEGAVNGDIRIGAGNAAVGCKVNKNANIIAGDIKIYENTSIEKNLIAAGGTVEIDGKIRGNARLYGDRIILKGEFDGNVEVNIGKGDNQTRRELIVLPGAVVHGKLTYTGANEAVIHNGAVVKALEWKKPETEEKKDGKESFFDYARKFVKSTFTALLYFLIGMLLFKFFNPYFIKQAYYMQKKPISVFGTGLAAFASIILSGMVFVLLILMSLILISPSIALTFGALVLFAYIFLFFFATIPVSLWLGNILLKESSYSVPQRFGTGLALITVAAFAFDLASKLPVVGMLFGVTSFFAGFAIIIFGIGTELHIIKDMLTALNKKE
ncbi:MAG: polymer-forming cytoskeletal protein [Clostridia bacterium]|nr:polymer-forming cytoskeletal protein [Clostridia bacterium]